MDLARARKALVAGLAAGLAAAGAAWAEGADWRAALGMAAAAAVLAGAATYQVPNKGASLPHMTSQELAALAERAAERERQ